VVRQEMAADYVRMGCAEVKKMTAAPGNQEELTVKRILVVGGGMSGMTSALEIAEAGYEVVLVEKTGALGGMAAKLWKRQPTSRSRTPPRTPAWPRWREDRRQPKIKVHLNSTIAETSGAPGRFKIKVARNPAR
jgi:quinone-modifying oxidoreductase subunit QmoB